MSEKSAEAVLAVIRIAVDTHKRVHLADTVTDKLIYLHYAARLKE